ncbi:hypothetical protein DFH09DRAFT_1080871 [Mycena vulgaris]|nr:hypothetical protein DFH09DRAFT_1080871 [Mycena vulgaris]
MLPQELVDAVVHEVEDKKSLRACALASSCFLETSQRILFRSLKLNNHPTATGAWSTRLSESPHIAAYITNLSLLLSIRYTSPPEVQSLTDLLGKLINIRRCTLAGEPSSRWAVLAPVATSVVHFIQQQPLVELHILWLRGIPLSILAVLVSSARTVSFFTSDPDIGTPGIHPGGVPTSNPTSLLLSHGCTTLCDVLARTEFSCYMKNVRQLGIRSLGPTAEYSGKLIFAVASTLETIRLECDVLRDSTIPPLPPLTALRFIDLVHGSFTVKEEPWLISNLSLLLAASPSTLEEISIAYSRINRVFHPPYFQPETTAALNRLLSESTASPRLRWRLNLNETQSLSDFTAFIERAMPRTHKEGKLVIQRYSFEDRLHEWPVS